MKKLYKVPVFKLEGIGPYNLSYIDNIIVFKSKFCYKELITKCNIICIDSKYNDTDDSINRIVIFKKDLNDNNIVDSDDFIEYSANIASSNWKEFYDKNISTCYKTDEKALKKVNRETLN